MLDYWKLLTDDKYRAELGGLIVERVLPMLAGIGIMIVGIVFVINGTKAGQVAGDLVDLAITKGAGKAIS